MKQNIPVEYIAFEKDGVIGSMSWTDTNDYYVDSNEYNTRFKGIEVRYENLNGNITEYHDMTDDDFAWFKDADPYEVGFRDEKETTKELWVSDIEIEVLHSDYGDELFYKDSMDAICY